MKDVNEFLTKYKATKADDRDSLVRRMVVAIRSRFDLGEDSEVHIREILNMTYDWGLTEGIEFAVDQKEPTDG